MIKGNNEITLNQATMMAALQHYFDEVLLQQPVTVVSVKPAPNNYHFADAFIVNFKGGSEE